MARPHKTVEAAELRDELRAVGLRATTPRVSVLQRLHQATTPLTHADLVDQLAPDGLDRATVYRNLMDLTEAGLVRRIDLGDHVWRFELRGEADSAHGTKQHPHFVCDECGEVQCLPSMSMQIDTPAGVPRALRRNKVEIQVKGRCDRCA